MIGRKIAGCIISGPRELAGAMNQEQTHFNSLVKTVQTTSHNPDRAEIQVWGVGGQMDNEAKI